MSEDPDMVRAKALNKRSELLKRLISDLSRGDQMAVALGMLCADFGEIPPEHRSEVAARFVEKLLAFLADLEREGCDER